MTKKEAEHIVFSILNEVYGDSHLDTNTAKRIVNALPIQREKPWLKSPIEKQ
jgi:hypothetical protein